MLTLLPEQAQILKKKPQHLSNLSLKLLQAAANAHQPHNKLLPASDVQQLFTIISQTQLTETNADAAYVLLASSCLAMVFKTNFNQMSENKLYTTFVLQYTKILESLNQELVCDKIESLSLFSKLIGRGIVMTKIVMKLLEKTKAFVPEYYRFIRRAVQVLKTLLEQEQLDSFELTEKEKSDTLILRICFSKKITREYILYLVKQIQLQVKKLISICPSSKQIEVIKTIREKVEEIGSSLSEEEKKIIFIEEKEEVEDKCENVYLEEPIAVRELTPRFYDEEKSAIINKLRRKKQKLTKKIEIDLRKSVQIKQQEAQVIEDVRKERSHRQTKKQMFVIEKQTSEARKMHKKMQKVKQIQKGSGKGRQTLKGRLDKLSQRKKKK